MDQSALPRGHCGEAFPNTFVSFSRRSWGGDASFFYYASLLILLCARFQFGKSRLEESSSCPAVSTSGFRQFELSAGTDVFHTRVENSFLAQEESFRCLRSIFCTRSYICIGVMAVIINRGRLSVWSEKTLKMNGRKQEHVRK